MVASHIPVQAPAGTAAAVIAALWQAPGVSETPCVAAPCDAIVRAGTRDIGEPAKLVTSRARAPGGGTQTMSCPVAHR